MVALREALSDFLPQAKHLPFEGEEAGWDPSPCIVLGLFRSLEPFSNLLRLISQAVFPEERYPPSPPTPVFPGLWLLAGLPQTWGNSIAGTRQLHSPKQTTFTRVRWCWSSEALGRSLLKQPTGKYLPFSAHCCAQTTKSHQPLSCLRQPPVPSEPWSRKQCGIMNISSSDLSPLLPLG